MENEEELFGDNYSDKEIAQESDNENNDANNDNTTSTKVDVKKRIVNRKPQVKLDPDRLCGPRGIPILPSIFESVKFKGKKHEKDDLDLLMTKLEHWAHRLYPRLPFDQVIDRIEKLGSKKPVQVCIKKMRLDLPILNADFVSHESDTEQDINRNDSDIINDPFDELLKARRNSQTSPTEANDSLPNFSTSALDISATSSLNTSTKSVLSDEVRERMERNRQLAMERRKKAQERISLLQNQTQSVGATSKAANLAESLNENENGILEVSNNVGKDFNMGDLDAEEEAFLAELNE